MPPPSHEATEGFTYHGSPVPDLKSTMEICKVPKDKYVRDWMDCYNIMEMNEEKGLRNRDLRCAVAALEYWNKQNNALYEITEVLGSCAMLYQRFWFHCNFRAKPIDGSQCTDSSEKLFFSELFGYNGVKFCCILDDKDPCKHF